MLQRAWARCWRALWQPRMRRARRPRAPSEWKSWRWQNADTRHVPSLQVLAAAVVLQVIALHSRKARPAFRLSHFCADAQEAEQAHAARDAKAEQKAAGVHDAEQLAVAAGQARLERAACMLASLQEAVAAVQAATMAEASPICETRFPASMQPSVTAMSHDRERSSARGLASCRDACCCMRRQAHASCCRQP